MILCAAVAYQDDYDEPHRPFLLDLFKDHREVLQRTDAAEIKAAIIDTLTKEWREHFDMNEAEIALDPAYEAEEVEIIADDGTRLTDLEARVGDCVIYVTLPDELRVSVLKLFKD